MRAVCAGCAACLREGHPSDRSGYHKNSCVIRRRGDRVDEESLAMWAGVQRRAQNHLAVGKRDLDAPACPWSAKRLSFVVAGIPVEIADEKDAFSRANRMTARSEGMALIDAQR